MNVIAPVTKSHSEEGTQTVLSFQLGDELFAMEVSCVREILDLYRITRVPGAPAHMLGVVNVRGIATAVMDLRARFGLGASRPTPDTRIVILEFNVEGEKIVVGGLADAVREVIELEASQITAPPSVGMNWPPDLVTGVARKGDAFILLLDITRLLLSETPFSILAGKAADKD